MERFFATVNTTNTIGACAIRFYGGVQVYNLLPVFLVHHDHMLPVLLTHRDRMLTHRDRMQEGLSCSLQWGSSDAIRSSIQPRVCTRVSPVRPAV